MFKSIILSIVAVLMMATSLFGQINVSLNKIVPKVNILGFASFQIPIEEGQDYGFRWIRVDADVTTGKVAGHVEFKLHASDIGQAYITYAESLAGGKLDFYAGKLLALPWDPYPGPKGLRLTRWQDALDNFPLLYMGTGVSYEKGKVKVSLQHSDTTFGALVYGGPVHAYYQDKVGFGFGYIHPTTEQWFNPSVGFAHEHGGRDRGWFENYVQVTKPLRFYTHVDFICTPSLMTGITYEYAGYSFVKLYVDGSDIDQIDTYTLFAELTAAFF